MTEIEDLSARLGALETVVGQLLTHLAVRTDDPPTWVATRRVLALHAMLDDPALAGNLRARRDMESAIAGFFDQLDAAVEDYGGTPAPIRR